MKANLFYMIRADRREYLGLRFFQWKPNQGEVIQVCVTNGEPKRGKSGNFGIYHISQMTFFSNYMTMGYAVPCKESMYREAFKRVVDVLK